MDGWNGVFLLVYIMVMYSISVRVNLHRNWLGSLELDDAERTVNENMGWDFSWQAPLAESRPESLLQIHELGDLVLPINESLAKSFYTVHDRFHAWYLMHNCIQLLPAFGDDGTDDQVFELNSRIVCTRKLGSGVRS
ncbi:uncharacterized protein EDB91DRAFT_1082711 [Suillus paluster]|uniref:uncharacterized protein n=1 Tax=Suillus paluster TaxID=48578 RepID=UPI001B864AD5|nr:uncharacterized protein EDB91DRAFT_1082711 [Suillus paluster]KAG1738683.1 hypothetical protein EDB91DRAFT_1082711 [Suillus paluster]